MESLPVEVIYIICDHLSSTIDVVNLASVSSKMALPEEYRRVINIKKQYVLNGVIKSILNIRYFTSDPVHGFAKRSLRINEKSAIIYLNNMICSDEKYHDRDITGRMISICWGTRVARGLYTSHLARYEYDYCFVRNQREIRSILNERNIEIHL